jgi:galactonate dehydratase
VKITRVDADLVSLGRANALYVQIHTDNDLVGVGETVMRRRDQSIRANVLEISDYLLGKDPLPIEDHFEKLYRDSFWVGGPLHAAGRSAIDIALWDLKGQHYNAPIYDMLGGLARSSIKTYCHCPSGATPADFAANLLGVRAQGYAAAKTTLPLFYGASGLLDQDGQWYSGGRGRLDPSLKETEYLPTSVFDEIGAYFAAAREAVGWNFELMVDCHGRLNPPNAIRLAEVLGQYRLLFIEEPIPPESSEDLAYVASRSVTPIAAGERLTSVYEVRPFLRDRSLAVLQCDIVNCGGFTGAKKIAAMAEAHFIPLAPHNPNGPIATLASAHLLSAIPNALILETIGSDADRDIAAKLVDCPPVIVEGVLRLSDRAGLGASLRDTAFEDLPAIAIGGHR